RGGADSARSVINQIELGIVRDLTPDTRHPTLLEGRTGPGLVPRLARTGNHFVSPQLPAGPGVMPRDVAAVAGILARAPGDHYAIGHNGTARIAYIKVAAPVGLPNQLASAGGQGHDNIILAHEIDLLAIERNAALSLSQAVVKRCSGRKRMPVLPQQLARHRIDRLDHVAGIPDVDHAVVDEGRRLVSPGLHGARPNQLQI